MIITRLLVAIPLLLAVSLAAFVLKDIMQANDSDLNRDNQERRRNENRLPNGFENNKLPLFYFAIRPLAYPDSLYLISNKYERSRIKAMLHQGVSWTDLNTYLKYEQSLVIKLNAQHNTYSGELILQHTQLNDILNEINLLPDSVQLLQETQLAKNRLSQMIQSKNYWPFFVPVLHWYGTANRYHQWLVKILRGDWGNSKVDYRPSWVKIKEAISWTLSINLISLILVFGLAIILGEWLFIHQQKKWSRWFESALFFMYSLPRFFLAILLIQFFASDTVHPSLHIFPSPGFFDSDPGASIFKQLIQYGNQLILPVIGIVLPSLAYLTRTYMGKLQDEKSKPYAFMAWSKGDSPQYVIKKHLRRNALMPIVALLGLEIPALIGGSVVIEVLFNLPGMGRLMLQSIIMQDWVIVFNILLLTGVFTIFGKLVSDVIYVLLDPKLSRKAI